MRVVVSFTTIPSRMKYLTKFIKNLKKQTIQPDMVYLNLPLFSNKENKSYPTPSNKLLREENLTIIRCKDYGPITKLLPVLNVEKDPNTIILIVDDDITYQHDRFEKLLDYHQKYPDSVLTGCGWIGNSCIDSSFVINPIECTKISIADGCSCCLYKRGMFDKDLLDISDCKNPEALYKNDDIWISGYLAIKGIDKIIVPGFKKTGTEAVNINALGSRGLIEFIIDGENAKKYYKKKNVFNEKGKGIVNLSKLYILILLIYIILILIIMCSIGKLRR